MAGARHAEACVLFQGKGNAASRLGQALGKIARASMHMSEGEGPSLSRRAPRRKHRKRDDAASADDASSQASADSMTERRHLKVSHHFLSGPALVLPLLHLLSPSTET